jgi:hypothetical protein
MRRRSIIILLALIGPVAACEKKDDMSPDSLPQEPDPIQEEKRLKRPPPASSGISSDPNNPNGAPGSGSIGTSPTRY